jgi:hypothetical protein
MGLGAGLATGKGWGQGLGLGFAGAANQQSQWRDNQKDLATLALQLQTAQALQEHRKAQLAQGDERNATYRDSVNNQGIPSGYQRDESGGLTYAPGGPFDPKVISEQSLARGRGAGVPQNVRSDAIKADQAYNSLSTALDDYETTVKKSGNVLLPGAEKDAVVRKRINIQLQLKELYNLGVLNGPDLKLMEGMLFDPVSTMGNFGPSFDVSGRVSASVKDLKSMMQKLRDAKAKGILPEEPAIGEEVDPFGIR